MFLHTGARIASPVRMIWAGPGLSGLFGSPRASRLAARSYLLLRGGRSRAAELPGAYATLPDGERRAPLQLEDREPVTRCRANDARVRAGTRVRRGYMMAESRLLERGRFRFGG